MADKKRAAETNPLPNPGPSILDEPQVPEKPTHGAKIINKFIIAALVVTALAIGTMFFWATASTTILDIKNSPFPTRTVDERTAAADGVIIMEVDYCKTRQIEGDLRISFISTTREIFLPLTKERGPDGCNKTEVPILIPKEIPSDTYKVKFRATYDINPLKQDVIQEFESAEFEINTPTQ